MIKERKEHTEAILKLQDGTFVMAMLFDGDCVHYEPLKKSDLRLAVAKLYEYASRTTEYMVYWMQRDTCFIRTLGVADAQKAFDGVKNTASAIIIVDGKAQEAKASELI